MITRIMWLIVDPCDSKTFSKLVEGAERDEFSSETTSGFLLDTLRKDFVEGRFIQKAETTETVLDPFGNPMERTRIDYDQLQFRLQRQSPHLEVYNAPRNLNAFLNRLGEFTKGAAAIYSPDVPISTWLEALAASAKSLVVSGLLISDLAVAEGTTAKVALTGTGDVRNYVGQVTQGKKHRLVQAVVSARFAAGDARLTIKSMGRVVVSASDAGVVRTLRTAIRNTLGIT
ncbi:MAG: hypothetical protein K8R23_04990 [Chthoniobacter sp.]|nr:hypothetical protein [Chthoniobacter sp.]